MVDENGMVRTRVVRMSLSECGAEWDGEICYGGDQGSENEVVRIGLMRTKVVSTRVVRMRW